jgi:hypothetical protein
MRGSAMVLAENTDTRNRRLHPTLVLLRNGLVILERIR